MKRLFIVSLPAVVCSVLLSACGDDVTKVTNVTNEVSGMEIVASADSLGTCDSSTLGKTVFASDENTAYVCANSGWAPLSSDSKSCLVEALSDSSGYKIICGEDSVGVVRNGENGSDGNTGEKGEAGENGVSCTVEPLSDGAGYKVVCGEDSVGVILDGANGNGCTLTDNGDGTVSQICGEDSITLYKAFCNGKTYDPEKAFCLEDSLYSCGEKAYSPDSQFCYEESVYEQCGGKTFVPDSGYACIDGIYGFEFKDSRDGQNYLAVKIGEQVWMAENLNYAYTQKTEDLDSSSFCYNDSAEYCEKYGRLYTWAAAMDSVAIFSEDGKDCGYKTMCSASGTVQGVCPEGWHLPSLEEWKTLAAYVADNTTGGEDFAGYALKSTSGWDDDGNGSDAFGFGTLPAGYRIDKFWNILESARFWSSTENENEKAYYLDLSYGYNFLNMTILFKRNAFSIRCVRD